MLNLTVETWIRFIVWMVLGVVIYFASRRNSVLGKRERGEERSVTDPGGPSAPPTQPQ